jgi:hypothetical protein
MKHNRYVYLAQIALRGADADSPEVTVELITDNRAVRDQLIAALPAERMTHRMTVEGPERRGGLRGYWKATPPTCPLRVAGIPSRAH